MATLSTWHQPEHHPALGEDEAHVWLAPVGEATAADEICLSADEKKRAARFQVAPARQRFVAARSALRNILGRYLQTDPAALAFAAGPHGKLALDDDALAFNLSHAGDFALVAVTRRLAVGVDIEKVAPSRDTTAIAERFFSPYEQARLGTYPAAARPDAFFRIWSRKEAVIKALGEGLVCPLASFDVSADEDEARLVAFRRTGIEPDAWTMLAMDAAPGYAAALAVVGRIITVNGFLYCRG